MRHIRTPLIVGYLWLFALWMMWAPSLRGALPAGEGGESVLMDILDAVDVLEPIGKGLAFSLAAFLGGSLVTYIFDMLILTAPINRRTGETLKLGEQDERYLGEGRLRIEAAIPLLVATCSGAVRHGWSKWYIGAIAATIAIGFHGAVVFHRARKGETSSFTPDPTQFSTRYATATEQLASEHNLVRSTALFELGKLAQHSPDYRETIYDILAAVIRSHAPSTANESNLGSFEHPNEIQAAVTALGGSTHGQRSGGQMVDLATLDLSKLTFQGGDYSYINLENCDLSHGNLQTVDLKGANLSEATLQGADLSRANLSGAHLGNANLQGSNLYKANLSGAFLVGADLEGANLKEATLRGAKVDGANLRYADLSKADLRWLSPLTIAADLRNDSVFALAKNLPLAKQYVAAKRSTSLMFTDLREANLKSADLRNCLFFRANLSRANLVGAKLKGAKLSEAIIGEIKMSPTTFNGVDVREAKNTGSEPTPPLATGAKRPTAPGMSFAEFEERRPPGEVSGSSQ